MRFMFALSLLLGCMVAPILSSQSIARARNEGTLSIPASNVLGNGNILAHTGIGFGYGGNSLNLSPTIGGTIGVGGILQVSGQVEPFSLEKKGLGLLEAHLQATLPGNDHLRFFGIGARADLYLSTSLDTLQETTDSDKPDYNPFLFPSIVVDLDFISIWNGFPLKAYMFASMADNPQLLHRYHQIAVAGGLEWKMYQHALFANVGAGFYKEKASRITPVGDSRYEQMYLWVEPGARYRFFRRFSLVGGFQFAVSRKLKEVNPLSPSVAGLTVRLEAPVYFRETDTEAIRSLVFIQRQKDEAVVTKTEGTPEFYQHMAASMDAIGDSTETFDYSRERQDLIRRRKEIQQKMEEIERLFEGIDQDTEIK